MISFFNYTSTNWTAIDKITGMSRRTALWLMVLCLLVAAALRLPALVDNPPGLHYDEAANGILAGDIGLRGARPIFIPSYTGKEPLFFYLAGSLMRLIGESVYALRLTAATLGLITVAATYWLGKELLGRRRIALLVAALLAVSFWHVLLSRLGFRAISQPLLQALTIAALFQGLRKDSRFWLITGGIALGLSAYTYLAVRLFPIPLALSMLPLLLKGHSRRRRFRQLLLFFIVGLVVVAPLIAYFVTNPEAFWVRVDQVFPQEGPGVTLLSSFVKSLGMFFVAGDPYWRFNIPDRPLFDWFIGALFVVGWLVSIVRLVRSERSVDRSAYLLLAITPFFMLLPTAIAAGEIVPSNLRAIGLLPFVLFLPALTLDAILDLFQRQFRGLIEVISGLRAEIRGDSFGAVLGPAVIILLLIVGGVNTYRTYFQEWSQRTDLYYDSDADLVAVTEYLTGIDTTTQNIFLASQHYRHPTVAFLSDQYDQIKWLPGGDAIVLPNEGSTLYIFPANSPAPEWTFPFLSSATVTEGPSGPDGEPVYVAYRVSRPADLFISNPVEANFDNLVTLLGYEIGSSEDGKTLPVTLSWQVERGGVAGVQPFVHLEDAWGYRWSQAESFAYPSEQWTPGEVVIQRVELPVRPGMPPGPYNMRIGFFDATTGKQLPQLDEQGRYAGNAMTVDPVVVTAPPVPGKLPDPPFAIGQQAAPNLTLLGYERSAESVASGSSLWLSLWWQATGSLDPMSVRLELVGPDNSGPILLNSTQPVHGSYPFDSWQAPQFIIDHLTPTVAESFPTGEYTIRMRLMDPDGTTISTADLGRLIVEEADRLYTPPKPMFPMEAVFGDEIELLGHDLEDADSGQFTLRLVWRALREPADSYTVFVHLLRPDGSCCVWQSDLMPRQGTYPTDGWLTGEVVVDEYQIELPEDTPAGQYMLELGFFIPETGIRLLVDVPGMKQQDALLLTRPFVVE